MSSLAAAAVTARLTHFNDDPGCKASNGVVSGDGTRMAFRMVHSADAPGIGHGTFATELTESP